MAATAKMDDFLGVILGVHGKRRPRGSLHSHQRLFIMRSELEFEAWQVRLPFYVWGWGMMLRLLRVIVVVGLLASGAALAQAAFVDVTLQQVDRSASNGGLGPIDLTLGGTALDWLKPVGSNLTFAEKDLASLLTLTTQGAVFTPNTYADDGYLMTWTGGDSASPSGSSFQGSNNTSAGLNVGFRTTFTAPGPGDYLLRWYAAGNNTQNWRLTGTIGAATDFQQAGTNVGTTSGSGAVDEFIWSVNFTADTAGQILTLDLLNSTSTNGAIAITGVTVAAIPEPSTLAVWGAGAIFTVICFQRKRFSRL
jgi:hypothetical protein